MSTEILSFRATVTVIRDFIEVAFHTILYLRQVYPPILFEQQKKYGVPVWASRNPALNQYIAGVAEAISEELLKGTLEKVALVIRDDTTGQQEPLERFIFDFEWLVPTQRIRDTNSADFTLDSGGIARAHVDDYLRGFMQKLNVGESYLTPLPPNLTFTVVIELTDDAPPPETTNSKREIDPAPWIPADARISTQSQLDNDQSLAEATSDRVLTPLRSTRLGMISLSLLVEEFDGKISIAETRHLLKDAKGKGKAV